MYKIDNKQYSILFKPLRMSILEYNKRIKYKDKIQKEIDDMLEDDEYYYMTE